MSGTQPPIELVKLTNASGMTRGGQTWVIGVPVTVPSKRRTRDLCTAGVLHAYRSVPHALLMDPVHGKFGETARIYQAETPEVVVDDGGKVGVWQLMPTALLDAPAWWLDPAVRHHVQVRFAALCARAALDIYERAYPTDRHPRLAIKAAEDWLADPTAAPSAAPYDAATAAYDAANAAATDASREPLDLNALAQQAVRMETAEVPA